MFAALAKSRKVFHSSVDCVQASSLGTVVILTMEKDKNLDFFSTHFFQSPDAMKWMAY